MPNRLIRKAARRKGWSVRKVERKWKEIAERTNYAIATAILKKWAGGGSIKSRRKKRRRAYCRQTHSILSVHQ